jgi:hypothetical protein
MSTSSTIEVIVGFASLWFFTYLCGKSIEKRTSRLSSAQIRGEGQPVAVAALD